MNSLVYYNNSCRYHVIQRHIIIIIMDDHEKLTKKALIKAVNSVRKKFRDLHHERSGEELKNVEIFKPVTGKLDTLIEIKKERKNPLAAALKMDSVKMDDQKPEIKMTRFHPYVTPSKITVRRTRSRTGTKYSPIQSQVKRLSEIHENLKKRNKEYSDLVTNLKENPAFEEIPSPSRTKLDTADHEDGRTLVIAKPKRKIAKEFQLTSPIPSTSAYAVTSENVNVPTPNKPNDNADEDVGQTLSKSRTPTSRKRLYTPKSRSNKKKKRRSHTGFGIVSPDLMQYTKNEHVSYTYWNDPNELVDRLRLLIASKSAGHSAHTNEIMSIIEELREENIIV